MQELQKQRKESLDKGFSFFMGGGLIFQNENKTCNKKINFKNADKKIEFIFQNEKSV